jgi:hypothetical protein
VPTFVQVNDDAPVSVAKAKGDAAFKESDFAGAITAWRTALGKALSDKHGVHGDAISCLLALRSKHWEKVRFQIFWLAFETCVPQMPLRPASCQASLDRAALASIF